MDDEEFGAPYEPEEIASDKAGSLTRYCTSPTNGRLEWVQAVIKPHHLNTGSEPTEEMEQFLMAGDKNPFDKPALIIHKSLGGRGDDVWNIFLEGRSFDRDTFDNEVESTVYHALVGQSDGQATVSVKFVFRNSVVTRPYRVCYQVVLPNGDIIENELANV